MNKKVTPAAQHFDSAQYEEKDARIRKILDDAAKLLEAEGSRYFLGAIDRRPETDDGGKVFCQSEIKGEDFTHILDVALPTRQDAVNLGIYVGQLINSRSKIKKSKS